MPDTAVRVEFLKKLHLFRGLSDTELEAVAEEMKEKTFEEADTVFVEGTIADSIHFIYQGRVDITRQSREKQVKVASLVRGDYFGEQGLLQKTRRNATVKAERGTVLLILYRDPFRSLLRKVPGLRNNFSIMMSSRRLAAQLHFKWTSENEVVYFIARKHQFLLWQALTVPILLLIPILVLLATAYLLTSATFGLVGGFLLVIDLAWGTWRGLDWGNDYYIVTNQRVIWLEKVIGLYDSRTEAGMNTILSVSTETDYWGRIFDYGEIVVRTFTGQIRMQFVSYPKQAAAMIEEYWNRTKEVARKADEEVMKDAIRNKLGVKKPGPPPAPPAPAKPAKKPTAMQSWRENLFRTREEQGTTITYRKHVFVLFRDTFWYLAGIVLLLAVIFAWPFVIGSAMQLWLTVLLSFAITVLCCYVAYEYVDWKNDIYQVTPEQIIDINRKPFGNEDRKAAPLENILSTEYKRRGVLGMLFNFGTVQIMVGGAQFLFEDVADPPTVQQDIVRRQQGRLAKKKEGETAAERDRMAEWLAMYHRTMQEIEREKNQSGTNPE